MASVNEIASWKVQRCFDFEAYWGVSYGRSRTSYGLGRWTWVWTG